MNLIKKIAQWVLSKELAEEREECQRKIIEERERQLEIIEKLQSAKKALEKLNDDMRIKLLGKREVLVSRTILENLVKCLPDSNAVGTGRISAEEIMKRNATFSEKIGGREYQHRIFVKKVIVQKEKEECGVIVHVSDYSIDIFVPLKIDKIKYSAFGSFSEIETYFWDFYGAGIRMLSDEAWEYCVQFLRAQRNVLLEFKEEGLL